MSEQYVLVRKLSLGKEVVSFSLVVTEMPPMAAKPN